jgi:ubiquitin carboxyl-terminal hydrolase L3
MELAHAAIRPRLRSPAGSQNEQCIEKFPARYLDYNTFSTHPEVELTAWKKNYTEGRWNSVAARIEFVQPDLTPLPHVIHYPWFDKSANIIRCDRQELPPIEELSFQASLIIKVSEALLSSGTAESPIISNHSQLLIYLFTNLFAKYTGEDEKHPENASSQRARRVRDLLFEMSGPYLDSITQRGFWIHHIMTAVLPEEIGNKQAYVVPTLGELLLHNLHLAYEDLPMIYYNLHRWVSEEGKEVVLEPDRLRIPGFLGARM